MRPPAVLKRSRNSSNTRRGRYLQQKAATVVHRGVYVLVCTCAKRRYYVHQQQSSHDFNATQQRYVSEQQTLLRGVEEA